MSLIQKKENQSPREEECQSETPLRCMSSDSGANIMFYPVTLINVTRDKQSEKIGVLIPLSSRKMKSLGTRSAGTWRTSTAQVMGASYCLSLGH